MDGLKSMNAIKVKFWGVRGSFPIPKLEDSFGGNTSCVEVRSANNDLVLLDMGTGLRNFGHSILKEKTQISDINIVLSHYHYDHILGFLMFIPLFIDKFNINIFAPGESDEEIKTKFKSFLSSNFWPVNMEMLNANINFKHYSSGAMNITNNVKVITSPHGHPGGASSIRVEIDRFSVTYITDCEHPSSHLNQNVIDIAKNTDILIHDAQYTPEQMSDHKGWGHSSWEHCTEVANKAKAKKLVLFHHNPDHGNSTLENIEQEAKILFENTISAREGMEVCIPEEVTETVIS